MTHLPSPLRFILIIAGFAPVLFSPVQALAETVYTYDFEWYSGAKAPWVYESVSKFLVEVYEDTTTPENEVYFKLRNTMDTYRSFSSRINHFQIDTGTAAPDMFASLSIWDPHPGVGYSFHAPGTPWTLIDAAAGRIVWTGDYGLIPNSKELAVQRSEYITLRAILNDGYTFTDVTTALDVGLTTAYVAGPYSSWTDDDRDVYRAAAPAGLRFALLVHSIVPNEWHPDGHGLFVSGSFVGTRDSHTTPQITNMTAVPSALLDTGTSALMVTAIDPDGAPGSLSYEWSILLGDGVFDDSLSASPMYTPADIVGSQFVTLRVDVSDDAETVSQTLSLLVTDGQPPTDTTLTVGIVDTGVYGLGSDRNYIAAAFEGTTTDLTFSVNGNDIDFPDEVAVYLNGSLLGHLSTSRNNKWNGGDVYAIPATLQLPGQNEILIVEQKGGLIWSVTDLLLAEAGAPPPPPDMDVALTVGTPHNGAYGNGYGSDQHEIELLATFDGTTTDLVFSLTGYDIDRSDEVAVYLNGSLLGYLSVGPNNNLNAGDQFSIPASDQLPDRNEIWIVEQTPGWIWGVNDLLLAEAGAPPPPPDADVALTVGTPHNGAYGNGYGSDQHEIELLATFDGTTTDLVFSLTGYDIDRSDEVAVYLNGSLLGYLSVGPNNNLNAGDQFSIPASDQLPDRNEIWIVEQTPGWIWGVNDLLLAEAGAPPPPPDADVALTVGTPHNGAYGNGYGSDQHEIELLATFDGTTTDLVFSLTGYDIDHSDEVAVYLNGSLLGYLSVGPNNELNAGDQFSIPAGLQVPSRNEIRIVERKSGWTWGVTDLLITN